LLFGTHQRGLAFCNMASIPDGPRHIAVIMATSIQIISQRFTPLARFSIH
jgi:hypothetical protein